MNKKFSVEPYLPENVESFGEYRETLEGKRFQYLLVVERVSFLTGKVRTMKLPVFEENIFLYKMDAKIQKCFPHLTEDDREFIMTGSSPEEWEEHLRDEG